MTINVTPIPRLIDLAAPAFTLGTANAAGSAVTAVASDATLLAFDTTDPAAVAASAVVGSATTAPRRDHVHPGIVGAGTVVDEAIARFNGTSGDSLQGYSSLSPTITDAGIITLTSGALKFPATEIVSGDVNTLDDYQRGTWTPSITFGGNAVSVVYSAQDGSYTKVGDRVAFNCHVEISNLGSSTGDAKIIGLPFTSKGPNNKGYACALGLSNVGYNGYPQARVRENATSIDLSEQPAASGAQTTLTEGNMDATCTIRISGQYKVA